MALIFIIAVAVNYGWELAQANTSQVAAGARGAVLGVNLRHGAKLEGQPNWRQRLPNGRMPAPPHDESGHTWHHADEVLFGITKHGLVPGKYAPLGHESDMPAFGHKLTDDGIWAVLAFIKSFWKTKELLDARAETARNAARR